ALFFVYLSVQPLFHTDLWGHVAYGEWILEHRALPVEDPYVEYAKGVPVIASAWLGQIVLAVAYRVGGPEGISGLFTVLVWISYVLLVSAYWWKCRQIGTAMLSMWLAFFLVWSRHATVRPEMFATFSFVVLIGVFCWLDRRRDLSETGTVKSRSWRGELGLAMLVFVTFLFWANAHGSFLVGVLMLSCQAVGRFLEAAWTTRSVSRTITDRDFHRWLMLAEIAAIACLINPYGMDNVINALQFSKNPNLPDVLEWKHLQFFFVEGVQMCLSWVLMLFLYRVSKQPVRPAEILMLGVLTVATVFNVRMIGWYGFVFAYAMLPHLAEVIRRATAWFEATIASRESLLGRTLHYRSHMISIVCLFFVWCGFALSQLGSMALGGEARKSDRVYSKNTPRAVTDFLRRHPPAGLVFNPQWWGDWLAWNGPPGLKVFMTTNAVHLAPNRYWRDYMELATGSPNWQKEIDKYNIETMIIHKADQAKMDVEVRNLPNWKLVYEDELAAIMSRDSVLIKSVDAEVARIAAKKVAKQKAVAKVETTTGKS
ncbi:MAG: hypothetical protein JWM11_5881, partial [Planctomycetaceae bacterium]|nr:hypothetical protein [Planctomycetaceae bacterium]